MLIFKGIYSKKITSQNTYKYIFSNKLNVPQVMFTLVTIADCFSVIIRPVLTSLAP